MAHGFKNKKKTIVYRHDEWHPDSFWTFRSEKLAEDDDTIKEMTRKWIVGNIDAKEASKAIRNGEDIEAYIAKNMTAETVMSTRTALLKHMSVSWGGPDFTVPDDFTQDVLDENGNPVIDPETNDPKQESHPLCGQVPPIEPEWINCRQGYELADIVRDLDKIWAGKSTEDLLHFKEAVFRVGKSGSGRKPAANKK